MVLEPQTMKKKKSMIKSAVLLVVVALTLKLWNIKNKDNKKRGTPHRLGFQLYMFGKKKPP
jgi:hypothetical protein